MSIVLSIGKYGVFYFYKGLYIRLCLGWIAITYFPFDIDTVLNKLILNTLIDKAKDDSINPQHNIPGLSMMG